MKGNEGKAAKREPMMRGWCVQQARGGGYRLAEVLIPASVVDQHSVWTHPPDMRGIVAAKIAQRLDTAEIPPSWPREVAK